jgi:hypothetical protein
LRTHTGETRIHTGDKRPRWSSDKTYTCQQCANFFAHTKNLLLHMRVHTGGILKLLPMHKILYWALDSAITTENAQAEKPVSCSQCLKNLKEQTYPRLHMRGRTRETPHSCFNFQIWQVILSER